MENQPAKSSLKSWDQVRETKAEAGEASNKTSGEETKAEDSEDKEILATLKIHLWVQLSNLGNRDKGDSILKEAKEAGEDSKAEIMAGDLNFEIIKIIANYIYL